MLMTWMKGDHGERRKDRPFGLLYTAAMIQAHPQIPCFHTFSPIQQCPPYTSHDHPPLLLTWPLDPTCHITWLLALDKTRPTACMLYHNKPRQRYSLTFLLLLTSQKNRTLAYNMRDLYVISLEYQVNEEFQFSLFGLSGTHLCSEMELTCKPSAWPFLTLLALLPLEPITWRWASVSSSNDVVADESRMRCASTETGWRYERLWNYHDNHLSNQHVPWSHARLELAETENTVKVKQCVRFEDLGWTSHRTNSSAITIATTVATRPWMDVLEA